MTGQDDVRRFAGDLRGAVFTGVDLSGARFDGALLRDVELTGVELTRVRIWADLDDVVVNGVDVAPLVEAELDRRDPDRVLMRPTDPEGFRRAWDLLEERWAGTVARARSLDPALLDASVDGEWSFLQTLRHLAFATDAWVNRVIGGDPCPWHPLGLPFSELAPHPSVPRDLDARPTLGEVLELRASRTADVRRLLDGLTAEQLDSRTTPVDAPSFPRPDSYQVRWCLLVVLSEEHQHRLFAERDLDALVARDGTE